MLGFGYCKGFVRMSADGAGAFALKGLGMMMSASKQGMAALSTSLSKVRKSYANKHEADVLAELRKRGVPPSEILFQAMQKLDYLSLAGYKHEVIVVSQQTAKRLLDPEKSTVPLDMTMTLAGSMSDEALKFGNFQKSSILQGLQEYLNMSRMGKDHYDRDTMVHEFYYAILMCSEDFGGDWQQFDRVCKDIVGRLVSVGGAGDVNHDAQHKAAKTIYTFASAIKLAAQQEDQKRQKSLREAEALIQREQEKKARALTGQSGHMQRPAVEAPRQEMPTQSQQTQPPHLQTQSPYNQSQSPYMQT